MIVNTSNDSSISSRTSPPENKKQNNMQRKSPYKSRMSSIKPKEIETKPNIEVSSESKNELVPVANAGKTPQESIKGHIQPIVSFIKKRPVSIATVIGLWVYSSFYFTVAIFIALAFGAGRIYDHIKVPNEKGSERVDKYALQRLQPLSAVGQNLKQSIMNQPGTPLTPVELKFSPSVMRPIDQIISYIVRDFINNWYVNINKSNGEEFPNAVRVALRNIFINIGQSASRMNPAHLILSIINSTLTHVREYQAFEASGQSLDVYRHEQPDSVFNRFKTHSSKCQHFLQLASRILVHTLPKSERASPVVLTFVREVFATSVLMPLAMKVADPHTINLLICKCLDPNVVQQNNPTEDASNHAEGQKEAMDYDDTSPIPDHFPHTICIKICEAKGVRQSHSKHPLLCSVIIGGELQETRKVAASKHPIWQQELLFSINAQIVEELFAVVIDLCAFEPVTQDQIIGTANIPLDHILEQRVIREWYSLGNGAEILVETKLIYKGEITPDNEKPLPHPKGLVVDTKKKSPAEQRHDPQMAIKMSIHQVVVENDGLVELMQFLETRGVGTYLQLYIMIDSFKQFAVMDAMSPTQPFTSFSNLKSDAIQIIDNFFTLSTELNNTSVPALDFGDPKATKRYVERLRHKIENNPSPDMLDGLQDKILSFVDVYHFDAFKETEGFRKFAESVNFDQYRTSPPSGLPLSGKSTSPDTKTHSNNAKHDLPMVKLNSKLHDSIRKMQNEIDHVDASFTTLGAGVSTEDIHKKFSLQTKMNILKDIKSEVENTMTSGYPSRIFDLSGIDVIVRPQDESSQQFNILSSLGASNNITGAQTSVFHISVLKRPLSAKKISHGTNIPTLLYIIPKTADEFRELHDELSRGYPEVIMDDLPSSLADGKGGVSFKDFMGPSSVERRAKRTIVQVDTATKLTAWLNTLISDYVYQIDQCVINFLEKPDEVSESNGEFLTMSLVSNAFKKAGSKIREVTISTGENMKAASASMWSGKESADPSKTSPESESDRHTQAEPLKPFKKKQKSNSPSNVPGSNPEAQAKSSSRLTPTDTRIIVDCVFAAIEECFQLTAPSQWLRQQSLNVIKVVLDQTYGQTITTTIETKIDDLLSTESVSQYLNMTVDALWPGGIFITREQDREGPMKALDQHQQEVEKVSVKNKAKHLWMGTHESNVTTYIDTIGRVSGRYNAAMGMSMLFQMLQNPELNEQLVCLLFESIVKSLIQ